MRENFVIEKSTRLPNVLKGPLDSLRSTVDLIANNLTKCSSFLINNGFDDTLAQNFCVSTLMAHMKSLPAQQIEVARNLCADLYSQGKKQYIHNLLNTVLMNIKLVLADSQESVGSQRSQLTVAKCLIAWHNHEILSSLQEFVQDIGELLTEFINNGVQDLISGDDKHLLELILYNVCDFLTLKGHLECHIKIYRLMRGLSSSDDYLKYLCKFRRMSHPLCHSQVDEELLIDLERFEGSKETMYNLLCSNDQKCDDFDKILKGVSEYGSSTLPRDKLFASYLSYNEAERHISTGRLTELWILVIS